MKQLWVCLVELWLLKKAVLGCEKAIVDYGL
jgi:hypothetical protein